MNHDVSNMGYSQTLALSKIYWKNYWEKENIDAINWEKLFDGSAEYK